MKELKRLALTAFGIVLAAVFAGAIFYCTGIDNVFSTAVQILGGIAVAIGAICSFCYVRALRLPPDETVFYKMHGIGNDYIYFDCMRHELSAPDAVSVCLSDRHKGIGGDGIVMICRSEIADAKMRMFNADGSEGKMCGNAIRCVGKFLYDFGKVKKTEVTVETLSGVKTLSLTIGADGKVETVRVDMGAPIWTPAQIPVRLEGYEKESIVGVEKEFAVGRYAITCVSMGNPHCIVFTDPDPLDLEKIGPIFENDGIFPERVNTEFVQVVGKNELKMRVWERGSGETWACGTGACAAAVAAVQNGFADRNADIVVHLRGGDLVIRWTEDTVYMTGSATLAFVGSVRLYGKDGLVHYGTMQA